MKAATGTAENSVMNRFVLGADDNVLVILRPLKNDLIDGSRSVTSIPLQ